MSSVSSSYILYYHLVHHPLTLLHFNNWSSIFSFYLCNSNSVWQSLSKFGSERWWYPHLFLKVCPSMYLLCRYLPVNNFLFPLWLPHRPQKRFSQTSNSTVNPFFILNFKALCSPTPSFIQTSSNLCFALSKIHFKYKTFIVHVGFVRETERERAREKVSEGYFLLGLKTI